MTLAASTTLRPRLSGVMSGPALDVQALRLDDVSILELASELRGLAVELWIVTSGSSMHPSIESGARVLLSFSRIPRIGDIVLIERDQRAVLHRIVWQREGSIVTRGDACDSPEPIMAVDGVRAVALAVDDGVRVRPLVWAARFGLLASTRAMLDRARALVRSRLSPRKR